MVLCEEIVTGATCSSAGDLKDPPVVKWKYTSGLIPRDINTVGMPLRNTTQVWNGTGPSVPPIIIGSQKIEGPRQPIIPQEVSNAKPLDAYINKIPAKHRDPTPSWSKLIGSKKITNKSSTNVYARGRMNLGSDIVLFKSPNFMDFGLSSVDATDELGSVYIPSTRIGRPTDGSNWLPPGHCISEAISDIVSGTKAKNHYSLKSGF